MSNKVPSQPRIVTRTIIGGQLQSNRQLGNQHEVLEYTTLNQAVNEQTIIPALPTIMTAGMEITADYDIEQDSDGLVTKYLVIGNGGHVNIQNPNDAVPYTNPVPHLATDTGLFSIMPFIIRPATDDLTAKERERYRLRRTLEINGEMYVAYFARVIEYPRKTPDLLRTTINDGNKETSHFIPTINNLRPTHPDENHDYRGEYVSVSSLVDIEFNETDIQELKDACRLLFGNERMAIISEIASVSGIDKPVTGRYPISGPQTMLSTPQNTFFEVVAAQVQVFITTYIPITYTDQHYKLTLDVGITEPLFGDTIK